LAPRARGRARVPDEVGPTFEIVGAVTMYNRAGRADLVIDAFGYFGPVGTS
jgi:hypothetical protein